MFSLGSVLTTGYSAHFVDRAYDRIADSVKALVSGDSTGDDAASSIIRELLRGRIAGSQQATRNASQGISTLQVFSEAVSTISDKLTEMSKLATKAGSGYYSDPQKYVMQLGFEELADEINDIAAGTKFNGNKLLSSDGKTLSIALRSSTIDIKAEDLSLDVEGLDLTTDPGSALAFTKQAIKQTSSYSGYLGGKINRLETTVKVLDFDIINAMGFQASISNTNLAKEIAAQTMGQIMAESVILIQTQANVNSFRALVLLQTD